MDRWSKATLIRLLIFAGAFIYGILDYFILEGDVLESIFRGFTVGLLLLILELLIETSSQLQHKSKRSDVQDFINTNRQRMVGQLLETITDELDRAIRIEEDKIIVEHRTLAISSYDTFWKLLVQAQEQRKTALHVEVVHSSEIDIWLDHPLTESLIGRQKQFCERGGKINRILCGRGSEPNANLIEAASKMIAAKIDVSYYDLSSNSIIDHNFAWDFAWIREINQAAIWDSFANRPGAVIEKAVYSNSGEYKGQNLQRLWTDIYAHSKPFTDWVNKGA